MEGAESEDSLHQDKDSVILRYGMLYHYCMTGAIGKSDKDVTAKSLRSGSHKAVDVVPTSSIHFHNDSIILRR